MILECETLVLNEGVQQPSKASHLRFGNIRLKRSDLEKYVSIRLRFNPSYVSSTRSFC
jgi:hypothetical protein